MNAETQEVGERLAKLLQRAAALHKDGKYAEAEPLYRNFLAFRPNEAPVWGTFAALLRRLGHFEPCIAANRKALQLDPGLDIVRRNLNTTLAEQGCFTEAEAYFREQFETQPDDLRALGELCSALRGLGRHDEVIALVAETRARLGDLDKILWQGALSDLTKGNYQQGFENYEHRYLGDEVSLPTNAPWPLWRGEDLKGKKILIVPEQGFGDAIVMARFLPMLKARGGEITMHVKAPLQRLFGRLEGLDFMVDAARASHKADFYLPNMSLPHRLGMPDGAPPPMARLHIPRDSRARARTITAGHANAFKIGVVWTGSDIFRGNNRRSATPKSFLGLSIVPGVQLFSLYKGPFHQNYLDSGMAGLIMDACGDERDFADTAALIEQMDLMITTDTAVVHLAGTLGKPVWNMLTREGYWMYGEGETTPWYPSMRLFRQSADGDWPGVFQRVEAELRDLLQARNPAGADTG